MYLYQACHIYRDMRTKGGSLCCRVSERRWGHCEQRIVGMLHAVSNVSARGSVYSVLGSVLTKHAVDMVTGFDGGIVGAKDDAHSEIDDSANVSSVYNLFQGITMRVAPTALRV